MEEEAEQKYVRSFESTSSLEIAGNLWVPPDHAVILAKDYGIEPWVRALLDPQEITNAPFRGITKPPVWAPGSTTELPTRKGESSKQSELSKQAESSKKDEAKIKEESSKEESSEKKEESLDIVEELKKYTAQVYPSLSCQRFLILSFAVVT